MQANPTSEKLVSKRNNDSTLSNTFRIMSRGRENDFGNFWFLIHFVDRSLPDLYVESSIFCTAVSCSEWQFLAGVN